MIQGNNLTNKEKESIAEFLLAEATGTLIQSEGDAVIQLLAKKEVYNIPLESNAIKKAITDNFSEEDITSINNDYYAGKL